MKSIRADGALYWKASSLNKLGRKADALGAISDLQQKFKDSRWAKDSKALEIEVRQSSGQPVTPESQSDEELKLIALRALMNSDAERAMPIIEQMLAGPNSPKVKDRALFVLSQSNSSRARDIIGTVAKGGNPDLQLRAIKYLGIMGGNDNRQILADVYRASNDPAVKRSIIRSFMVSGDRTRLLGLAKAKRLPSCAARRCSSSA
jgi:HEAT repeat protein